GSCAMSECDLTIGQCVSCIPDGDLGCRSSFDCCSQVCGADGVCESTTTTTSTTSTTETVTTTTLACVASDVLNSACTMDDQCCSDQCGSMSFGSVCCDVGGSICDVQDPAACCSGTCALFSQDPLVYHCTNDCVASDVLNSS